MDTEMRALELRNGSRDYLRMSQRPELSEAERKWARDRAKGALREAEEIERAREELTAEGVQYALPGIAKADNGGLF